LPCIVPAFGQFLKTNGEQPVTWKRAATMEDVLREADVVSQLIDFKISYIVCIIAINLVNYYHINKHASYYIYICI